MSKLYAGLDVSQDKTSVCVVDACAAVVFETEAPSTPDGIARALLAYRRRLAAVGHETGLFTPWLHRELLRKRYPMQCLDARQTRAALAAQRNKTDRNDARDIAIALSRGFCSTAFVKSEEAHKLRLLLTYRRALKRKARDIDATIRSCVKVFGAKYISASGQVLPISGRKKPDSFVVELSRRLVAARAALWAEGDELDRMVKAKAREDKVCRRLMTAPGVGPLTALAFKAAVDDPSRFESSRDVAAHFGLTPRRWQSGEMDLRLGISRFGDADVRAALYEAAWTMLICCKGTSKLRSWGLRLAETRGLKHASTACARKLAVILHRMWVTGSDFDPQVNLA